MGRVIEVLSVLDPSRRRVTAHEGPLIDWLLDAYPQGFDHPHAMVLNQRPLAVADYDRALGPDDTAVLVHLPGIEAAIAFLASGTLAATVAKIAISTVISIGLNWSINKLFGPKASKPRAPAAIAGTPSPGSVYSLSVPQNVARIGQPIPVPYGKNLIVPDQATTPYSYFEANEQYVCQLMCIGQGEYDVHNVYLANTDVASFAAGIVSYQVLGPAAHVRTFGQVYAATGIYENLYTSPEVSDQEIIGETAGAYSAANSDVWYGAWDKGDKGPYGMFYLNGPQAAQYVSFIRAGTPVWAVLTDASPAGNNGTYQVSFIRGAEEGGGSDPSEASWGRRGHIGKNVQWPAGNGKATITLTIVPPGGAEEAAPVGPHVAMPPCWKSTLLEYDIVFPGGLYRATQAGGLGAESVALAFYAEPIDDSGTVTGPPEILEHTESGATNTPQRRTLRHAVPDARYRVTAYRLSPKSDLATDQSAVYWTGLKSYLRTYCDGTDPIYGDVTLLAVRIRATQGISSEAHSRVSVRATRKLGGVATRSPVDAFEDIYTNAVYGGRRPAAELDADALALAAAETAGCQFDAVFDQPSTIWEGLQLSVQMIRGIPVLDGGMVGLVRDKPVDTPVMGFNQDSLVELTRAYLFAEAGDPDGIEGEWIDATDGSKQYAIFPATATDPERITLWGCTSSARAFCFVRQFWRQRLYRRRLTTFTTELDANALQVGDPINLEHPLLGSEPVLHVVSAVRPQDELTIAVEAYIYQPEVFQ